MGPSQLTGFGWIEWDPVGAKRTELTEQRE